MHPKAEQLVTGEVGANSITLGASENPTEIAINMNDNITGSSRAFFRYLNGNKTQRHLSTPKVKTATGLKVIMKV